jgi:hypothetical protein
MSDNRNTSSARRDGGHDRAVERFIEAAPATAFDAFLDSYGADRPDWIVESRLDYVHTSLAS